MEIPDFASWLELGGQKQILKLADGTECLEIRTYRKKVGSEKQWLTGISFRFFGKEVMKSWNSYENNQNTCYLALELENGTWAISIPWRYGEDVSGRNIRYNSQYYRVGSRTCVRIVISTPDGWKKRTVFSEDKEPPKK